MQLMVTVQGFDTLLQADGDEEADDDGDDVDEEVAPGAGGVVGWVDVEHVSMFLGRGGGFGGWDVFGLLRLEGWRRVGLGRWRLIWRAIGHRLLR
jgi:hypothetical protein